MASRRASAAPDARSFAWAACFVALGLAACARERVDVAEAAQESDDAGDEPDDAAPSFPAADAAVLAEGGVVCGPPPQIGRCPPCDGGYAVENGAATCTCCP